MTASGNITVNPEKLEPAHNGDDFHMGLDMIGSSTLYRAIETALFEFGRLASFGTGARIFPLPYVSEHGVSLDNGAATPDKQQQAWSALTSRAPAGRALPFGTINNGARVDWEVFEVDYSYVQQPHKIKGKVKEAGTGFDDSKIDEFYSFLAENIIPDLAAFRVSSKLDGARTLRLGIASHSHFLRSVFGQVCGLDKVPANNDVLAIPMDFVFSADGLHTLTPKSMEGRALEDFCGAQSTPVSQENAHADRRLGSHPVELCPIEAARCQRQIDIQQLKPIKWLGTGLGKAEQCMCCTGGEC